MKELEKNFRSALYPLFENSSDTLIDSCLQGYCGRAFVSAAADGAEKVGDLSTLGAAVACGDFIYFGGRADGDFLKEILFECPVPKNLVPMNGEWCDCIAHICGANAKRTTRFATAKGTTFDKKYLKSCATAPEGFKIERVDGRIFNLFAGEKWSRDFTANFADFEQFERLGAGYAATFEGRAVAGACSYSVCDGAIEVQIITHPCFRKKGLARACSASLILDCIERGIYPNWDAEHAASLHIAQSLGYEFLREYTAFVLSDRE
ncbi:MAG: GNAT family N-acetyltransferase [Candidatus Coproplasma sp.]